MDLFHNNRITGTFSNGEDVTELKKAQGESADEKTNRRYHEKLLIFNFD
jgi:hypothetical protein